MTTDDINDLLPDPEDDPIASAQLRGIVEPTKPYMLSLSAGSFAVLQASGNKLIFGDTSRFLIDAVGFHLLHNRETREDTITAFLKGQSEAAKYIMRWMDEHPESVNQVGEIGAQIAVSMETYTRTLTTSKGSDQPGNASGRTG
jgi:hypothetical protein